MRWRIDGPQKAAEFSITISYWPPQKINKMDQQGGCHTLEARRSRDQSVKSLSNSTAAFGTAAHFGACCAVAPKCGTQPVRNCDALLSFTAGDVRRGLPKWQTSDLAGGRSAGREVRGWWSQNKRKRLMQPRLRINGGLLRDFAMLLLAHLLLYCMA